VIPTHDEIVSNNAAGVQFDAEEGFDQSKVYNESDEEPDVADLVSLIK